MKAKVMDGIPSNPDLLSTPEPAVGIENSEASTTSRPKARKASAPRAKDDQNALRRNLGRYHAIIEGSDDAIVSTDLDGNVTSWNRGATQISGYSANDMIGKSIMRTVPCEFSQERTFIAAEIRAGRRIPAFETIRIAEGDRRIPICLTISPIHDSSGVVIGASIIARDISDRKRLEDLAETARQEKREAEQTSLTNAVFMAAMSNEFHMPLTSVEGFANILLSANNLTNEQRNHVESIKTAISSLRRVSDDLLDFQKIEAGQFELEKRPFSPKDLMRETLSISQILAQSKNLNLHGVVEDDIAETMVGDFDRLRQILLNLVNNAIKFTANGSIKITVGRDPSSSNPDTVRFSVRDSGIGVPPENQNRLFHPFSQTNTSIHRRYDGNGLGLTICKALVDTMDGDIGVESILGQGSTFWFTVRLPQCRSILRDHETSNKSPAVADGGARILVVEDSRDNREFVEAYLGERGYQVESVDSAIGAIEMCKQRTFDLVLMDIQMPVMDGVAATKIIRAMAGPKQRVPILAMTGHLTSTQIKSYRDAGMNGHVAKPISVAKFDETVRRWSAVGVDGARTASHI